MTPVPAGRDRSTSAAAASSSSGGTRLRRVGIVGGGILGLALAVSLQRRRDGLEVVVYEKEPAVARHQTGRNSGVVHAGLYYPPGSLKARLCVDGMRRLRAYCAVKEIPYFECGKVVVALEEWEEPLLRAIQQRAHHNGVRDVRLLDRRGLQEIEPHADGRLALHSPHTAIVDFAEVARHLAADLAAAGCPVRVGAEVTDLRPEGGTVRVRTRHGEDRVDALVNCAGLHADRLARMGGDEAEPRIVPFRGEYHTLAPDRRHLVRGLIYPVPDPRYPFLGVHLTRRIDGEVLVGPNAVLALAREGYTWGRVSWRDLGQTVAWPGFRALARQHWRTGVTEVRRSLSRARFAADARRYVPEIRAADLRPGPAGVRAQALDAAGALVDDFRLTRTGAIFSVRNAPSPAATSSFAIGDYLADWILGQ